MAECYDDFSRKLKKGMECNKKVCYFIGLGGYHAKDLREAEGGGIVLCDFQTQS